MEGYVILSLLENSKIFFIERRKLCLNLFLLTQKKLENHRS